MAMRLADADLPTALALVAARLPRRTGWQYRNQPDDEHPGFTVWGEFVLSPDEDRAPRFFITFGLGPDGWPGDLTVGQHAYFWTSADVGDAYLLTTPPCATLEEAIAALKTAMRQLARRVADE